MCQKCDLETCDGKAMHPSDRSSEDQCSCVFCNLLNCD